MRLLCPVRGGQRGGGGPGVGRGALAGVKGAHRLVKVVRFAGVAWREGRDEVQAGDTRFASVNCSFLELLQSSSGMRGWWTVL